MESFVFHHLTPGVDDPHSRENAISTRAWDVSPHLSLVGIFTSNHLLFSCLNFFARSVILWGDAVKNWSTTRIGSGAWEEAVIGSGCFCVSTRRTGGDGRRLFAVDQRGTVRLMCLCVGIMVVKDVLQWAISKCFSFGVVHIRDLNASPTLEHGGRVSNGSG